jgi:two-component system, response regulator
MNSRPVEILLVEDDPNDAELALRALGNHSSSESVRVIRDGAEALEWIFATGRHAARNIADSPRLILLDLKLPLVDGKEVLRRVKTDPRTRRVPVVVLSSSQEDRDIADTYHLGVNSYITKPVDIEQYTDALQTVGTYWLLLNQQPPI